MLQQVDTVLCVSLSPAQQLLCLCPQADALGKKRGKPSIFLLAHVSSDSFPLPVGCLSHHLCLELALKLLPRWIRHCPCHLHWDGPPLLHENKKGSYLCWEQCKREREPHIPWQVHHNIASKQIFKSYILEGNISSWIRGWKRFLECLALIVSLSSWSWST